MSSHLSQILPLPIYNAISPPLERLSKRTARLDRQIDLWICRQPWGLTFLRIFGPLSILSLSTGLILIWLATIIWGERLVFSNSFNECQWDKWESWPSDASPHHVALVADPQLVDPHTYPGRPWPLSTLTINYADQYMRRSYGKLIRDLDPDTVFFLGDLFDGGREWSTPKSQSPEERWRKYGDQDWQKEFRRFGKIFLDPLSEPRPGKHPRQAGSRKVVTSLPGNHDLGFSIRIKEPVRDRFWAYFGEGNRVDVVGNHSFVSLDTVSLSAVDSQYPKSTRKVWEPAMNFLNDASAALEQETKRELSWWYGVPQDRNHYIHNVFAVSETSTATPHLSAQGLFSHIQLPTVLLSHVPLYRPPGTPCGPLREKYPPSRKKPAVDHRNAIAVRAGYQYQNVLTPDLSRLITNKIGTVKYAFSGDDHDYCEVMHQGYQSAGQRGIREITVKSISWAMGVRRPGFMMVSLWNPLREENGRPLSNQDTTLKDTMQVYLCLIPDQLGIFIRYALLLLASLLAVGTKAFVDTQRSTRMEFYYGKPTFSSAVLFSTWKKGRDGKRAGAGELDSDSGSDVEIDDLEAGLVSGSRVLPQGASSRSASGTSGILFPGSSSSGAFHPSTPSSSFRPQITSRSAYAPPPLPDGHARQPYSLPRTTLETDISAEILKGAAPIPSSYHDQQQQEQQWHQQHRSTSGTSSPLPLSFLGNRKPGSTASAPTEAGDGLELPDPEVWWTRFRCGCAQVAAVVLPVYFWLIWRW